MKIDISLSSILNPTLTKDNVLIHLLVGAFFPLLFDDIGMNHGVKWLWIVGVIIVGVWAPYKEFYLDPRDETKDVSGGIVGDITDFLEYMIGLGTFLLVKFA